MPVPQSTACCCSDIKLTAKFGIVQLALRVQVEEFVLSRGNPAGGIVAGFTHLERKKELDQSWQSLEKKGATEQ